MFSDLNENASLPKKVTCDESEDGKCASLWGNIIVNDWKEKRLYYNIANSKHTCTCRWISMHLTVCVRVCERERLSEALMLNLIYETKCDSDKYE